MALRPVERLLVGYLSFTTLLGLIRISEQPAIGWVILANLLTAILIFLVAYPVRKQPAGCSARSIPSCC